MSHIVTGEKLWKSIWKNILRLPLVLFGLIIFSATYSKKPKKKNHLNYPKANTHVSFWHSQPIRVSCIQYFEYHKLKIFNGIFFFNLYVLQMVSKFEKYYFHFRDSSMVFRENRILVNGRYGPLWSGTNDVIQNKLIFQSFLFNCEKNPDRSNWK